MKLNINGNLIEVSDEALSKAIEDKQESLEVESKGLVIRTTDQQESFEANLKKEVGDYKVEIGRKEVLNGLGIEIEGQGLHKSLDKSLEAIKTFVGTSTQAALSEAGKAPDGKIKELTSDNETLRGNLKSKDEALELSKTEFTSYKNNAIVNKAVQTELSKYKDINNSDNRVLIFNSKQLTGLDDSGVVRGYNQDGTIMKDSNLDPLSIGMVASKYYENNPDSLTQTTGGAGGEDSGAANKSTDWDSFVQRQNDAGNSPASEEFARARDQDLKSGALVM